MSLKIEKILNLLIGVVLLTNLYLLGGLTKIPHLPFIALCLLVSFFYTLKRFDTPRFFSLLNNWLVICYFSFSVLLAIIDFAFYGTQPMVNDLVRVVLYAFYFSWTYLILHETGKYKEWFVKVGLIVTGILLVQGLFELNLPLVWNLFLSDNVEKRTLGRIGGTLIDSNSFACTLILIFIIIYLEHKNHLFSKKYLWIWVLGVLVLYLNDLSGSRQGLVAIAVFVVYLVLQKINVKRLFVLIGVAIALAGSVFVFEDQLISFAEENPSTAIGRVFVGSNNSKSAQSNIDRTQSLVEGYDLLYKNYFLYGPGILNFHSRWSMENNSFEPHNGLLFLLVQYGLFAIPIFYFFYLSYKRGYNKGVGIVFLALVVHLVFQPNSMYYAITFFVLFYIDIKYFHSIPQLGKVSTDA